MGDCQRNTEALLHCSESFSVPALRNEAWSVFVFQLLMAAIK